ncbi:serpin family protein [Wukongibacter sp. M2B1]|uniref:serpin family protein n=1 Tax=Wukongibacter sp. M2B1 TaxID=3088895 RepID=UPI003D795995
MKRKTSILLVTMLLLISIISGCSTGMTSSAAALSNESFRAMGSEDIKENLEIDENNIAGLNNMGYRITESIYTNSKENILFSPLSLSSAIAMLTNGAENETKNEIIKGMEADEATLNATYNHIINLLNSYSEERDIGSGEKTKVTVMNTANSAWFQNGVDVKSDFVDNLKKYYNADAMKVDFSNPNTKDIMNKWIEEKTNNILKDTIKKTKPTDIAYLINTLYFKGTWRDEFYEGGTKKAPFYLSDGSEASVDMMFGNFGKPYYEDDTCQIVGLNYYDATMYVLLPKENLNEFIKSEKYAEIDKMIESTTYNSNIDVYFPKFKYKNSTNLNDHLKNIGIAKIFDPGEADLTRIADMSPENLYVSNIFQNTSIEVDEKGTEAAAVTVVEMECTSAMPTEKVVFNCNKPFMYVIKDDRTGTNLFMGIVQKP